MSTLIFLVVFTTVLGLINLYSYKRFIKRLELKENYLKILKVVVMAIFIFEFLYAVSFRFDFFPQWVYYTLSVSIGLSFILFVTALLYDITHISINRLSFNEDRRKSLKLVLDLSILIVLAGYIFRGFFEGSSKPVVKNVSVKLEGLQDLKIVHLTDVHIGNVIKKEFIEELVARVNALKPDLVAITGDLIDKDIEKIAQDVAPLKNLKSTYGTFFCYGNHEYFHGAYSIGRHLETLGIKVLADEVTTIDSRFNIVGLKDLITERFDIPHDFKKPFKEIDNSLPTIVLSHQPRQISHFEEFEPELILSGHTHGGQIFPFSILVSLAQPYLAGLYKHSEKTQIYVSRGTGFWGPPIRVLAPSEIAQIKIV